MKIERKLGNISASFDTTWAKKVAPSAFRDFLLEQSTNLRVAGFNTEEVAAVERFYAAAYIKGLLEELEDGT